MEDLKIAAQLFSFRSYCRNSKDVLETLSRIREMGYDGVEIEGVDKIIDANSLAQHLKKIGLKVCSTRSRLSRVELDFTGMVEEARLFDCQNVGIGTIPADYAFNNPQGWQQYIEYINTVAKRFSAKGLRATYSVEAHEFIKFSDCGLRAVYTFDEQQFKKDAAGSYGFDSIVDGTESEKLFFELDTFWLAKAGVSPADIIRQLVGRIKVIRFRDQRIAESSYDFFYPVKEDCEVGKGVFDFASLFPVLKESGVEWISIGQNYFTRDPFESMSTSLKQIQIIKDGYKI